MSPAFRRRGEAETPAQEAPVYPPYGSMLMQPPPMPQGGMPIYPYGMPPAYPAPAQSPGQPQGEIYDELIVPEGRQLPWRKAEGKGKKEKKEKQYQTRMTFTPGEMGADTTETQLPDTLIMSASKRKAMDRIEEIRRRKAQIAGSMGVEGMGEDAAPECRGAAADGAYAHRAGCSGAGGGDCSLCAACAGPGGSAAAERAATAPGRGRGGPQRGVQAPGRAAPAHASCQ